MEVKITKKLIALVLYIKCRVLYNGFRFFPGILEVLGSSGRLIGLISTYPDISPTVWLRVMAQNPGGAFFTVYGILLVLSLS